jgi:hypothetical protein
MACNNPSQDGAQPIPVYQIDAAEVEAAYGAFAALRKAVRRDPALLENAYFEALQDTAYARFLLLFEAL